MADESKTNFTVKVPVRRLETDPKTERQRITQVMEPREYTSEDVQGELQLRVLLGQFSELMIEYCMSGESPEQRAYRIQEVLSAIDQAPGVDVLYASACSTAYDCPSGYDCIGGRCVRITASAAFRR